MKRNNLGKLTTMTSVGAVVASMILLASWTYAKSSEEPKVIYGNDDRHEPFDPALDIAVVKAAKSTAIFIKKHHLVPNTQDDSKNVQTSTFGQQMNLCKDEPFYDEPNPGFCSGFLVADDVMVTAGHCIKVASDCEDSAIVFDYGYFQNNQNLLNVKNDKIYNCKEIISQTLNGPSKSDYAVIRLDRKVAGRTPLKVSSKGKIADKDGVVVIGYPSGLPVKITDNAFVRDNVEGAFFLINSDTYGGNSGSAVLNSQTLQVEGILVRGENDFETQGTCRVSKHCKDNECMGEGVTRSSEFIKFIPPSSAKQDQLYSKK